ncbi:MAG: chromate resistance protein [Armatimonadota bacterium]|nr:chromate resistance protein [Armatimonadota bacterium]
MVKAFGPTDPALRAMAEIVHETDLRDGRYARPETAGVNAILRGWRALPDRDRETHGVALFEGLYTAFSRTSARPR